MVVDIDSGVLLRRALAGASGINLAVLVVVTRKSREGDEVRRRRIPQGVLPLLRLGSTVGGSVRVWSTWSGAKEVKQPAGLGQ